MKQLKKKDDLQEIKQAIDELKTMLKGKANPGKQWMKSAEVIQVLGCSHGSLRNYREKGMLKFIKVGGSYNYDSKQVYSLINQNSIFNG